MQRPEDTANKLLALERMVINGVLKAAEEAMENLKLYVVFPTPKEYHKKCVTIQNTWGRNVELNDLADKSLATQILDHEAYEVSMHRYYHYTTTTFLFFLLYIYTYLITIINNNGIL